MNPLALAVAVLLDLEPPAPEVAVRHAVAAVASGGDAAVLLAIAHAESRHRPGAVSRLECGRAGECRRRASLWRGRAGANWRAPFFCGVTQVRAANWRRCRALLGDDATAFRVAARELRAWTDAAPCRRRHGRRRLLCALAGYGAGWRAAEFGSSRYARRVVARAERLTAAAGSVAPAL